MADETSTPKIVDVAAPEITKHSSAISENLVPSENKDAPPMSKQVSNIGANIAPVSSKTSVEELPTTSVSEHTPPMTEPEQNPEPSEEAPAQTSPYEASDSLPDLSQKLTTELTNEMQAPHIYDTKEYVVPIKDTMHSHGTFGKILAGIISAVVVVGIVIAAAYYLV